MKVLILVAFAIVTIALEARADFNRCRWTIEGTNANFADDSMNSQPPQIVSSNACAASSDGTPSPNVCVGNIYCEDAGRPPFVGAVACAALDNGNGKYSCPTASACAGDITVAIGGTGKIPVASSSSSNGSTNGSSGAGNVKDSAKAEDANVDLRFKPFTFVCPVTCFGRPIGLLVQSGIVRHGVRLGNLRSPPIQKRK